MDWDTPSPAELKIDTSPEEQISIGEPGPSRPRERTPPPPRRIPSPNKVRTRRRAREEGTTSVPSGNQSQSCQRRNHRNYWAKDVGRRLFLSDICLLHLQCRQSEVDLRTSIVDTLRNQLLLNQLLTQDRSQCLEEDQVDHGKSLYILNQERKRPLNLNAGNLDVPPKKKTDQQSSAAPQPAPRRNRPQRRAETPPPIATQNPITTRDSDGNSFGRK